VKAAVALGAVVIIMTGTLSTLAVDREPEPALASPKLPCPANGHKPALGKVTIISDKVFRGKTLLRSGDPIYENSTLCAKNNGQVKFSIRHPNNRYPATMCRMDPGAELRAHPKKLVPSYKQPLIRFEAGWAWCATGKEPPENLVQDKYKYDADQGRMRILTKDPLFAVGVNANRTLIKLDVGFVKVSRVNSTMSVIIGPRQQVTIPTGGEPQAPRPIEASPTDKRRFDELRPALPTPNLGRPDPAGSPALARILRQRAMVVGVEREVPTADRLAEVFARRFFGYLADEWQIDLKVEFFTGAVLRRSLDANAIDVAVTSDARLLDTLDTLPLFADPQEDVWQIGLNPDDVFKEALRGFVVAAVTNSRYRTLYRGTFKREPRYDTLNRTLFP
jgi:hypothetical protein